MGRKEGRLNYTAVNKKHKTGAPMWRPVFTPSNTVEGITVKVHTRHHATSVGWPEMQNCSKETNSSNMECGSSAQDVSASPTISSTKASEENSLELSANAVELISQHESIAKDSISSEAIYNIQAKDERTDDSENINLAATFSTSIEAKDEQTDDSENINLAATFSTSIEVDASLIRFIKGKGGKTQRRIEGEAGVKIKFPSSKQETTIVIEGASKENVTKASDKIQILLGEAIRSPSLDYSHFISLPLAIHPTLVEKLVDFQKFVLGNPDSVEEMNLDSDSSDENLDNDDYREKQADDQPKVAVELNVQDNNVRVKMEAEESRNSSCASNVAVKLNVQDDHVQVKLHADELGVGNSHNGFGDSVFPRVGSRINRSLFIKEKTFHLTVVMLKLWNKERIAAAMEVLQNVSSEVNNALNGRPIYVRLKGLECMKGSPAKARVIYVPVEEVGGENRLSQACKVIINAYVQAGLVLERDAQQQLKLHATVMNVRHRKRKNVRKRMWFEFFDARDILKQFGSQEWGEYLIQEAHLSQRFAFDLNGYYRCCAAIPFPDCNQP